MIIIHKQRQKEMEKFEQNIMYEEDFKEKFAYKNNIYFEKQAKIYLYMKIQWFRLNQENFKAVESMVLIYLIKQTAR